MGRVCGVDQGRRAFSASPWWMRVEFMCAGGVAELRLAMAALSARGMLHNGHPSIARRRLVTELGRGSGELFERY